MRTLTSFLLTVLILWGCDTRTTLELANRTFEFDGNISNHSRQLLSGVITQRIDEMGYPELERISKIVVDTIPFGFILNVSVDDSVTHRLKTRFKALGRLVSDSIPIHLILQNTERQTITTLPYDYEGVKEFGKIMRTSRSFIAVYVDNPAFEPGGLEMILRSRTRALYAGTDTVEVYVTRAAGRKNLINIDIGVNASSINLDTVRMEFSQIDPLLFAALFADSDTHINIVDNGTKQVQLEFEFQHGLIMVRMQKKDATGSTL